MNVRFNSTGYVLPDGTHVTCDFWLEFANIYHPTQLVFNRVSRLNSLSGERHHWPGGVDLSNGMISIPAGHPLFLAAVMGCELPDIEHLVRKCLEEDGEEASEELRNDLMSSVRAALVDDHAARIAALEVDVTADPV